MNTVTIDATEFDQAILVKRIRSGQDRPYADTVDEAEITFTGRNISTKPDKTVVVCGCHPKEDSVKAIAKVLISDFCEPTTHPLDVRLDLLKCVKQEPGLSTWFVRIVTPFCD